MLQSDLVGPSLLPWLLVAAGLVLAIAEAMAPGAHFIVVGVALLAAGLVGLAIGQLAGPVVLGVLVLLFGAAALWGYREFDLYGGKGQGQTRDSESLKGQTGRVTERVTPTDGQVKLDAGGFNPFYSARTLEGEIPEGEEVMVIDPGGGNVLTVESLGLVEDDIDRQLRAGRELEADVDGDVDVEVDAETAPDADAGSEPASGSTSASTGRASDERETESG